jgi:chromosome partitioning protein
MHTISIINYKGGVGKTTLTANIAAELARRGRNILLIDLDPQASLTFSFITPEKWLAEFSESKTIKDWFESFEDKTSLNLKELIFTPEKIKAKVEGKLDMIASHLDLINIDLELATKLGGATLKQTKKNFLKVHRRLAEGIKQIENEYDLILIDCPPNFNIVTKTAIVASDYMLIPTKADYLSTIGIDYLTRSVKQLVEDYNDYAEMNDEDLKQRISPKILGVVFTMIQVYGGEPIAILRQYIQNMKKLEIPPVFTNYLRENKSLFSDAPNYSVPVVLVDENSPTHRDIISEIGKIVNELEQKLGWSSKDE